MYLKSIEVHGFKSFAKKTTFNFHKGVTGIVGPNGSGKSNIADAVRWVLGEQSAKQLRGTRMEDVIFSGTETRRPLGFAYVAITLDNSDHRLDIEYDEVTVARRVYRSGESEYLINGSNCRLKDIHELFVDTGIGKEGYSIIGQGQIDKILSERPEDRRELFDEAVGIVKYKRRKAITEKNLAEQRLNLSRVTDIILEIEKQLKPLEKQSEAAKEFLSLREQLKSLEINQFLTDYDRLRNSKESLDEKLNIANNDLNDSKKEFEKTKEEYIRLEYELEEYDKDIEDNRNRHNDLKLHKEKLDGEINVLQEQISSMLQNDQHYQNRIATYDRDIASKKEEEEKHLLNKEKYDAKISEINLILTESLNELNKIKEDILHYNNEIEESNNQIFDLLNTNSDVKSNLERYETMLEQNTLRKAELNQRLLLGKSKEEAHHNTIERYNDELKAIVEEINKYTEKGKSLQGRINDSKISINSITNKLNENNQNYLSEKSRLESLINITERYEGYGNSIKKVMELKDEKPGILGVVADIIKTDKRYETAIETALGGSIQNIVTDNEETAKELINYLKKNRYGRATFLPLTNMSLTKSNRNENLLKEKGVISFANNLVEVDSQYDGLMRYLLGRNIVVDNMDNATSLARKYRFSLRIVTLDGELLSPGGSMSGGAYRNTSNLLGRRREIEDREDKIASLQKTISKLRKERQEEENLREDLIQKSEDVKTNLQELYIKQNTSKLNLDQEAINIQEAKDRYNQYVIELQEIENQSKELNNNIEILNNSLSDNLSINKKREEEIEKIEQLLQEEKEKETLAEEKVSSMKMEVSSLQQNSQFITENLNRIKGETKRLYEEKSSLLSDKSDASKLVSEKRELITIKKAEIEGLAKSISDMDSEINEQIHKKEEITNTHKNFFTKREELSSKVNELDKECFRLANQKEKLLEQIDGQMNYMWEEYQLTYTSAIDYPIDKSISIANVKKSISEVKEKIKALGPVNVNAIEDYKDLLERYEFLTFQKEDLVSSEEDLIEIIEQLDIEMRKQFEENFSEIDKQFNKVFKELFGGGKASLELTDDEDMLEAGIRINAQPPGKKLQNIMQLSGGEKALTAISLLFAIQKLKPSPFCLLDEIEAALDDSNVNRFADYLIKLSKETQFIVITHRKGTMVAADVLYGITMQEKGISTLVSVNLIENELDE